MHLFQHPHQWALESRMDDALCKDNGGTCSFSENNKGKKINIDKCTLKFVSDLRRNNQLPLSYSINYIKE